MLRPYIGTGYSPPGDPQDLLDQLVVPVIPRRARPWGSRSSSRGSGMMPGSGFNSTDVRDAEAIDANVDAAPIAAAERLVGIERDALGLAAQRIRDTGRRALEDRERMLARVPDPLGLVSRRRVARRRGAWRNRIRRSAGSARRRYCRGSRRVNSGPGRYVSTSTGCS